MKKCVVCIIVALFMLSLNVALIPNGSSQTQNIKILSYTYYIDSQGFLDFAGEVQNIGSTTIHQPYLTGSVQVSTPNGEENSPSFCEVWQSYLAPQQKAPFYMQFQAPQDISAWQLASIGNITLTPSQGSPTSQYEYSDFNVSNSSLTIGTGDANGFYVVNGVIQNTGTQTAYNITLAATFYNATGTAIAVGTTYQLSNPWITPSLAPSATVPFQVYAYDLNATTIPSWEKIQSYSLIVQSTGPYLQGIPPAVDNAQGSGTISSLTPTHQPSNPNDSSFTTEIAVVTIAVVILAVTVAAALLMMRRSKKRRMSVKEAKKAKKTNPLKSAYPEENQRADKI